MFPGKCYSPLYIAIIVILIFMLQLCAKHWPWLRLFVKKFYDSSVAGFAERAYYSCNVFFGDS